LTLRKKVERFRDERDWRKFHNPKDLSIALTIEASELEELFLWKDKVGVELFLSDQRQLERVREEMADIGIYLLSLSSVLDVDLSEP
jgi:dCTP diphosphatase